MLFRKKFIPGLLAPDYPDSRDYLLSDIQPEKVELPESFDLRGLMTPVENQRNKGVCYSYATCAIKQYLDTRELKKINWKWNEKENSMVLTVSYDYINLSERFLVHFVKKISGLWDIMGDYFRNSLKAITKYGACLEESWPTDLSLCWQKFAKEEPPLSAQKEALKYRGGSYWRIVPITAENIKQAIYQNQVPVLIGMSWHRNFNRPEKDGKLPLPDKKSVGGHAVCCVGWNKNKIYFRNSWGPKWGNNGYFYILEEEFEKYPIWDCWVLLDYEPVKTYEGYVAIKYLKAKSFKKGQKVYPTYNLNLRKSPSLKGEKIITIPKNTECEVLEESIYKADGYTWQKIKVSIEND